MKCFSHKHKGEAVQVEDRGKADPTCLPILALRVTLGLLGNLKTGLDNSKQQIIHQFYVQL